MKRFTETDKWRDPWFRRLPSDAKLAFWYLTENCDAAGVWDADFELADFQVGSPMPWATLLETFGDRVHVLPSGKWYLTRFIEFQYGKLSVDCKPHQAVLRLLQRHGITLCKGNTKGFQTLEDKEKDKEKEKDRGKGAGKGDVSRSERAMQIYEAYPRKQARPKALKAITEAAAKVEQQSLIHSYADPYDYLLEKTTAYAAAVAGWPAEDRAQFVPQPATWFNQERYEDDPATWSREAKPQLGRFGQQLQ